VREIVPIPAPGQPPPAFTRPDRRGGSGGGRSGRERHDRRYTVQEMLREGQEVLVQVAKEGIGQKGPALTTYLSMPGRYLVLMPAVQRLGVSKRIDNEEQRRALKDALNSLNAPEDMGVIVRTAGTGKSKEELQRDLDYLMHAWDTLKKKAKMVKAPSLIFQEGDIVTRVFRDVITDDVAEIVIDDPVAAERAREYLRETAPGSEHKVKLHEGPDPLFHKYGVEQQLQRLFNRKVNLRSGGSIVIEQTEALVAIDVNTGRFREKRNQDDTILQTNLEAAREIARQLRLRDIGGLVMIDFIDMEIHEHRRRVERELKAHLARDKARINVLPVSSLGVVEMTRQRIRHSLRKTLFDRCPHCSGSGHVKSAESLGLEMLREIKSQLRDSNVRRVKVLLNSAAAFEILNQFRKDLARLEEARGITIEVRGDAQVPLSQIQVSTAREGGDWVLKKISEVDDYVRNS
jgi:ribonuclease E